MAKAELGLKRTCLSCGMRYYDFNRTPIICPGCQTEFDPELVVRSRRGRVAPKSDGKAGKVEAAASAEDAVSPEEDDPQTDEDASAAEGSQGEDEFEGDDIDVSNDDSAGLIADDLDEGDEIIPGIPKADE
ncbi:MAG: TIGR02300 family protein [Rhodobiaceae bacterium]